jgi:uncharacterized protein (DUF362 family)
VNTPKAIHRRAALKVLALAAGGAALACRAAGGTPPGTPPASAAQAPSPAATSATRRASPEAISTRTPPSPPIQDTEKPTAAREGLYFRLHPFLEAHPEAVFIERTQVDAKTNTLAKRQAGFALAQTLFEVGAPSGIPLGRKIAIKPNLTGTQGMGSTPEGMGIVTDRDFVEGLIQGMLALGFDAGQMYLREGNWLKDGYSPRDLQASGYLALAERTGVHLVDFPTGRKITDLTLADLQEGDEVTWVDCPDGVVFKRIGYVAPYNDPDSWLLNIAKLKAHGMGMTLCAKNLQGMCVSPHVHFCEGVEATLSHPAQIRADFQPDLEARVAELHRQHVKAGIPRWDRPGQNWNSGYGMEMWAQRTCDSLSVTRQGLSIIEGIYGRNGNGFMKGPGPNGEAQDFLCNWLIFGKDPFRVDLVGTWLAGHEPGNFGLFHVARERGLSTLINPMEVPVYDWGAGKPRKAPLAEWDRIPLKTYYLQRDYAGQNEPFYHMVDESYPY